MKIQREIYRRAWNAEEIADLCWKLSSMLQDNFSGYEIECSRLRAIAIEFEKEFDSLVDHYYA